MIGFSSIFGYLVDISNLNYYCWWQNNAFWWFVIKMATAYIDRYRIVQKALGPQWTQAIYFNSLRPRQNGRHFADDIFKCIFLNENIWIPIKMSLKFVSEGPINNIPALVQVMAWCRTGDKPLSVQRRIYASLGLNELTLCCCKWTLCILRHRTTFFVMYM